MVELNEVVLLLISLAIIVFVSITAFYVYRIRRLTNGFKEVWTFFLLGMVFLLLGIILNLIYSENSFYDEFFIYASFLVASFFLFYGFFNFDKVFRDIAGKNIISMFQNKVEPYF